ncbi:unnamed protein product [Allacma fusca]|uniref:Uncharacterized protein n=1 Tax=Allacma fusca TaxID=39272 RepID=A0A8J2KUA6_9HEXA|nr:unnamed protein product [Allacma fusca]
MNARDPKNKIDQVFCQMRRIKINTQSLRLEFLDFRTIYHHLIDKLEGGENRPKEKSIQPVNYEVNFEYGIHFRPFLKNSKTAVQISSSD